MMYLKWLILFVPVLLVELVGYVLNPFVALFIVKRERTDRVKRIDNKQHTLMREYLVPSVYDFQAHDNAVDEYWYGKFNDDSSFKYIREMTQERYDNSKFARYTMRVLWLYRNNVYGLLYRFFSTEGNKQQSFNLYKLYGEEYKTQYYLKLEVYATRFILEGEFPILPTIKGKRTYNKLKIGWKAHKNIEGCMYANRVIGIRIR